MRAADQNRTTRRAFGEQAAAAQQQVKRVIGRIEAAQSCRCAPGKEIAREDDLLRRLQRQFRQCSLKSIQRQIERSEESRVGTGCVSHYSLRCAASHQKKKTKYIRPQ